MENEKIGQFILELRKAKQMTQKDLATKLNITDKAVSKWERGVCAPDISLLSDIAEIFDITTGELLNGEKSNYTSEEIDKNIDNVLLYANKNTKSKTKFLQNIYALIFSMTLLIGLIVCVICDLAISGSLTWSLFPICSIIFTWLVFIPVIKYGIKGIIPTMVSLSVFIIPFLYVLSILIKSPLFIPISIRMAVISIIYLWIIIFVFKKFNSRKILALAITLSMSVPINILINYSLTSLISTPLFDVWDILAVVLVGILAMILFVIDLYISRKQIEL